MLVGVLGLTNIGTWVYQPRAEEGFCPGRGKETGSNNKCTTPDLCCLLRYSRSVLLFTKKQQHTTPDLCSFVFNRQAKVYYSRSVWPKWRCTPHLHSAEGRLRADGLGFGV